MSLLERTLPASLEALGQDIRPRNPIDCPIPRESLIASIVFDSLGLPEQYFVSPQINSPVWTKLIGRVIGLQSVLMSSLQLGSFSYAKTTGDDYMTIVIAQDCCYLAMVLEPTAIAAVQTSDLCRWMGQLDGVKLKQLWES